MHIKSTVGNLDVLFESGETLYEYRFTTKNTGAGKICRLHDHGEGAEALGVATHDIPPLMRAGLLKPLGHPQRYCMKKFSRETLARNIADETWLDKVAAAIHRHWRIQNALKRARQAQLNGQAAPTK